jgi:hypothetical protein
VGVVEAVVVDNGVANAVAGSGEAVGDAGVHAARPTMMLTMQTSQLRHIYVCFIGLPSQKQEKQGIAPLPFRFLRKCFDFYCE